MYANRIQHLIPQEVSVTVVSMTPGFVPCPPAVLAGLSPEQQSAIDEVYRVARERTQEQLREAVPAWQSRLQFSRN